MEPLLLRRGVDTPEAVERFLDPRLEHLHDPAGLAGLPEAVERLVRAREAGERVAIVGDYDVDGVSGTALLVAVFGALGLGCLPILPHRLRDGYGFQPAHVTRALEEGCKVVVTVDCGTTSYEAIDLARAEGLDVVVTDHHLPGSDLPPSVLLVNPKRSDCTYPFPDLSGAGLAYKLAIALAEACGRPIDPRLLVRIACLGTVADLVPLRGENRILAAVGLRELERTRSVGLRALMRVSKIRAPFSTDDIGYRIGPRLNAPGRLDSAEKALDLLLCRDPRKAESLARNLEDLNQRRRREERQVVEEAEAEIRQRAEAGPLPSLLLAWSESWHRGVVGIAAGRLARTFNRPTILLAVEGDAATGSGRSIRGAHLHEFLQKWSSRLPRFGGHAQAIGLTVATSDLEELRAEWESASSVWDAIVAEKSYEYELDLSPEEVDSRLLQELLRLEPHGQENARPLTRIRGPLELKEAPRTFGQGNLEATLHGPGNARIRVVGWGWSDRTDRLRGACELLGYLERSYRSSDPTLRLVDARPITS